VPPWYRVDWYIFMIAYTKHQFLLRLEEGVEPKCISETVIPTYQTTDPWSWRPPPEFLLSLVNGYLKMPSAFQNMERLMITTISE